MRLVIKLLSVLFLINSFVILVDSDEMIIDPDIPLTRFIKGPYYSLYIPEDASYGITNSTTISIELDEDRQGVIYVGTPLFKSQYDYDLMSFDIFVNLFYTDFVDSSEESGSLLSHSIEQTTVGLYDGYIIVIDTTYKYYHIIVFDFFDTPFAVILEASHDMTTQTAPPDSGYETIIDLQLHLMYRIMDTVVIFDSPLTLTSADIPPEPMIDSQTILSRPIPDSDLSDTQSVILYPDESIQVEIPSDWVTNNEYGWLANNPQALELRWQQNRDPVGEEDILLQVLRPRDMNALRLYNVTTLTVIQKLVDLLELRQADVFLYEDLPYELYYIKFESGTSRALRDHTFYLVFQSGDAPSDVTVIWGLTTDFDRDEALILSVVQTIVYTPPQYESFIPVSP